jgi:hypothetical protein
VGTALNKDRPATTHTTTHGTADVLAVEALGPCCWCPACVRSWKDLKAALIEAVLDRGVTWEQLGATYGGRTRQIMQSVHRPWPDWLAGDRTLPRRVRSAVRAFERISDTGSTVKIRAATEVSTAPPTPDSRLSTKPQRPHSQEEPPNVREQQL